MTLPPLYKYLDVQGATLTLQNRCFKHAKPSTFNDTEDLTIRSIFPEDDETALELLKSSFVDVLVANIDKQPTCHSERMQATATQLLRYIKRNPQLADLLRQQIASGKLDALFNLEEMKHRNSNFVADINRFMQDWRILCVSSLNDSEKMWTCYSEDHQGVVLRILPNGAKDSKYQLFRPVTYREKRPSLYESAASFQESSLFGNHGARTKESMHSIIYSKTLEWEYESEYRLAICLGHGEKDWNTLTYHSEELSEMFLGAKATDKLKTEFVGLAQGVNPEIKIFDMSRDVAGKLIARAR